MHKMRRVQTAAVHTSSTAGGGAFVPSTWRFGPPEAGVAAGTWIPPLPSSVCTMVSSMHAVSSSTSTTNTQNRGMKNKGNTINFGDLTPASKMLNRRRGYGVVSRNDLRARKKRYNFLTSERLFGQINRSAETTTFGSKSLFFKENNEGHKVHRRILAWYRSRYVLKSKLFPQHLASRIYSPSIMIRSTWGEVNTKGGASKRGGTILRSEVTLSKDLLMQAMRGAVAKFSNLPEVLDARKEAAKQVASVAEEGANNKVGEEQVAAIKKIYGSLPAIDLRKHLFRDESFSRMLGGFQRCVLDYEFRLREAVEVTERVIESLQVKQRAARAPAAKAAFNVAMTLAKDLLVSHKAKLAYTSGAVGGVSNKLVKEELLRLIVPSCIYVPPFSLLQAADRVLSCDTLGLTSSLETIVDKDLVVEQQQFLLLRLGEATANSGKPSDEASEGAVPVVVSDVLRLYLEHSASKSGKKVASVPSERELNTKILEAQILGLRGEGYLTDCKALAETMAAAITFRHHPVLPDSFSLLPDKDRKYRKLVLGRSLLSYTKMNAKTGQAYIRAPSYKVSKDMNTMSEFLENCGFVKGTNVLARSTGVQVADGDSTASVPAYVSARDSVFLEAVFNDDSDAGSQLPSRVAHSLFRSSTHHSGPKHLNNYLRAYEPQYQFFRGLRSSLVEAGEMSTTVSYVEDNAGSLAAALAAEVRYLATLRLNFIALPDTRALLNSSIIYNHHARSTRERITGIEFDTTTLKITNLLPQARRFFGLRGADLQKSQLPMRPAALMELMLSRQRAALRRKIVNGIASKEEKDLYDSLIEVPDFADLGPVHRGAFTLPFCERLALGEGRKTYRNPFSNYLNFRFAQIREALNHAEEKGYLERRNGKVPLSSVTVMTRGIAAEWLQLPQAEKNKFDFTLRQHAFSGAANAEGLKHSIPRPGGLKDDTNHAQFPLVNPNQANDDHLYEIDESAPETQTRSKKAAIRLEYEDYLRSGGAPMAKRNSELENPYPSAAALLEGSQPAKQSMRRFANLYLHDPHGDAFCPTTTVRALGGGGDDVDDLAKSDAALFNELTRRTPSEVLEMNTNKREFSTPEYLKDVEAKKPAAIKLISDSTMACTSGLRAPTYLIQLLADVQSQSAPFYQKVAAHNENLMMASKAGEKQLVSASQGDDDEGVSTFNYVFDSLMETLASASSVRTLSSLPADTRYNLKVNTPLTSVHSASVRSIQDIIEPHLRNMIKFSGIRSGPKRFTNKLQLQARVKRLLASFKENRSFFFPKLVLKRSPTKMVRVGRKMVAAPESCVADVRSVAAVVSEEPVVPALLTTDSAHLASAGFRSQCIQSTVPPPTAAGVPNTITKLFQPGSATSSITGMAVFASVFHNVAYHTPVPTVNWSSPGVRTLRLLWPDVQAVAAHPSSSSLIGNGLPTTLSNEYRTMCSDAVIKPHTKDIVPASLWASVEGVTDADQARAYERTAESVGKIHHAVLGKRVAAALSAPPLRNKGQFPELQNYVSTDFVDNAIRAVSSDPSLRPVVASVPLVTEEERDASKRTGRRFIDFAVEGKWSPSSAGEVATKPKKSAASSSSHSGIESAFTNARRRVESMLYFPDPLSNLHSAKAPPAIPKGAMEAALTNKKLITAFWPSDALVISSRVVASKAATKLPPVLFLADQSICQAAHKEATKAENRRALAFNPLSNPGELAYPSEGVVARAADVVINYLNSKGLPTALPTAIFPLIHTNALVSSDFDDRQQIRDVRATYVFPEMSEEMEQALLKQRLAERATKEQEDFAKIMSAMTAVASEAEAQAALERLDSSHSAEDVVADAEYIDAEDEADE